MPESTDSNLDFVVLIDQGGRFLLRLLDGLPAAPLRYSEAKRLARSLRRVKAACETRLTLLEGGR